MKYLLQTQSKKGQRASIYLFFILVMLVPIAIFFAAPLFGFFGSWGVQTSGATGLKAFILDNMNMVFVLAFALFIILWNR